MAAFKSEQEDVSDGGVICPARFQKVIQSVKIVSLSAADTEALANQFQAESNGSGGGAGVDLAKFMTAVGLKELYLSSFSDDNKQSLEVVNADGGPVAGRLRTGTTMQSIGSDDTSALIAWLASPESHIEDTEPTKQQTALIWCARRGSRCVLCVSPYCVR